MIGLLQRVRHASVVVDNVITGEIDQGLLVLIGVQPDDERAHAERMVDKLLGYRVFADAEDRMNLSVQDIGGGVLLVPQFTLAADTSRGMRPSFSSAAPPEKGRQLFDSVVDIMKGRHQPVATGVFGADMQVSLQNDGPVTFWLQC